MSPEQYLTQWQKSQSDAETMSLMIGKLYREKGVEIQVYGRAVINASTIDLIKSHRVARWYTGQEVSTSQTLLILEALSTMALSPCRIDIGRLASQYWQAHDDTEQLDDFSRQQSQICRQPRVLRSPEISCCMALAESAV